MSTLGHNSRLITIGNAYKLRGYRSHINGKHALVVCVTGIIGGNGKTESRHPNDRFIASDGRREFYGVSRKDLIEIKP